LAHGHAGSGSPHTTRTASGTRRTKGRGRPSERSSRAFSSDGSTTFNLGVPDDETIASRLQARLADAGLPRPPGVYNFGRGAYFSVQTYNYDLSRHVYQRSFGRHEYGRYGYPRMAEYVQQHDRPDFIWCADIQDGTEPLYVDQVHYAPALSACLARCIADAALARRLLG